MALGGLQLEKPMRTWDVSAPACVRATKANEPLLLVQLADIHDVLDVPWNGMSQLLAKRESQVFEVHVAILIHHIPASFCSATTKDLGDACQGTVVFITDSPDGRVVIERGLLDDVESLGALAVVDILHAIMNAIHPAVIMAPSHAPPVGVEWYRPAHLLVLLCHRSRLCTGLRRANTFGNICAGSLT